MHPIIGYLIATTLVTTGIYGVLVRRNAILLLMALELLLTGVNLFFITADATIGSPAHRGQISALFVIVLAAAEIGVGLAIVLRLYRARSATVDAINVDTVDTGQLVEEKLL
jgi:NADH-quinone oxidoreductase subunit K